MEAPDDLSIFSHLPAELLAHIAMGAVLVATPRDATLQEQMEQRTRLALTCKAFQDGVKSAPWGTLPLRRSPEAWAALAKHAPGATGLHLRGPPTPQADAAALALMHSNLAAAAERCPLAQLQGASLHELPPGFLQRPYCLGLTDLDLDLLLPEGLPAAPLVQLTQLARLSSLRLQGLPTQQWEEAQLPASLRSLEVRFARCEQFSLALAPLLDMQPGGEAWARRCPGLSELRLGGAGTLTSDAALLYASSRTDVSGDLVLLAAGAWPHALATDLVNTAQGARHHTGFYFICATGSLSISAGAGPGALQLDVAELSAALEEDSSHLVQAGPTAMEDGSTVQAFFMRPRSRPSTYTYTRPLMPAVEGRLKAHALVHALKLRNDADARPILGHPPFFLRCAPSLRKLSCSMSEGLNLTSFTALTSLSGIWRGQPLPLGPGTALESVKLWSAPASQPLSLAFAASCPRVPKLSLVDRHGGGRLFPADLSALDRVGCLAIEVALPSDGGAGPTLSLDASAFVLKPGFRLHGLCVFADGQPTEVSLQSPLCAAATHLDFSFCCQAGGDRPAGRLLFNASAAEDTPIDAFMQALTASERLQTLNLDLCDCSRTAPLVVCAKAGIELSLADMLWLIPHSRFARCWRLSSDDADLCLERVPGAVPRLPPGRLPFGAAQPWYVPAGGGGGGSSSVWQNLAALGRGWLG